MCDAQEPARSVLERHTFELLCSLYLMSTFVMISHLFIVYFYLPSNYLRRRCYNMLLWVASSD